MKLEVGMYVRTQNGLISKIQGINEYSIALKNTCCERLRDKYFTFPNEEKIYEISKSSFNLIDLIELGDYVNGRRVGAIGEGDTKFIVFEDNARLEMTVEENIKSIVTHEQFKSMEYEVK
jgi:hypothetical protein